MLFFEEESLSRRWKFEIFKVHGIGVFKVRGIEGVCDGVGSHTQKSPILKNFFPIIFITFTNPNFKYTFQYEHY